ncbi:hypothetical protein BU15DRAFT_76132 [Melanogaster broomeanus]|nr:hypothetical protein BU15DRAFT_76132 [Melanogaster broomeanus]
MDTLRLRDHRDRVFDIADVPFTAVHPEEMRIYTANIEKVGYYAGYKARQDWARISFPLLLPPPLCPGSRPIDAEVNRIVTQHPHPQALRPFLPELAAFVRHNHFNVLHPNLRLIALNLELPEETLPPGLYVDIASSSRRTEEEEEKSQNVGSRAIQWVRHIDNILVINTGDMMDFFTGGFYKPTIHRVVQPREDQRAYDRLGSVYFTMADDDIKLLPLAHSPVLQGVGISGRYPDDEASLSEMWRKGRTTAYDHSELKKGSEKDVEEEVIEDIVVKHYN